MFSILWNFCVFFGKEIARAQLSWWFEAKIKYQESCVQSTVVNQRLNRGEELESAYTLI